MVSRAAAWSIVVASLLLPASASAAWTSTNASGKCTAMSFVADKVGYGLETTVVSATLQKTTNGSQWAPVAATGLPQQAVNWLHFVDESTGFVVRGNAGTSAIDSIAKTATGGTTWTSKPITLKPTSSGSNTWLTRVAFGDKTNGVAVGLFAIARGFVAVTRDGGETWSEVDPPPNTKSINNVLVLAPNHWVVFGGAVNPPDTTVLYTIWNTRDGGATWQRRYQGGPAGTNTFAADSVAGVLWANQGCAGPAAAVNKCVLRSTDGGDSWDTTMDQYLGDDFTTLAFADAMNGVIVGPKVFSTKNGGIEWTEETVPAGSGPYGCAAYPGPSAYAGPVNPGGPSWIANDAQGGGPRAPTGGSDAGAGSGASSGGSTGGETGAPSAGSDGPNPLNPQPLPPVAPGASADGDADGGCSSASNTGTDAGLGAILIAMLTLVLARRDRRIMREERSTTRKSRLR